MTNNDSHTHDPCAEIHNIGTPSGSNRKHIIIGSLLLLLSLFLFGFFPRLFQSRKLDKIAAADPLPKVTILVAEADKKPIELILPSSTAAHHTTPIWARANGYIARLLVDIGDVVKENQLLAILETPELDQQYEQALGNLARAESQFEIAKISAERWQLAYSLDPGSVSKQELDTKVADYISAQSNVAAAEANARYYKDLMDFKFITAPFDGIITERNVDLGSLITAGSNGNPQQLFVIDKTDYIRIFVDVPQKYAYAIHDRLEGAVTIQEFPKMVYPAKVKRYAKALDPVARTLKTELHIDNSNGQLYAGLYANVQFTFTPQANHFIIPTPAVIIRSATPKVAVLDEKNIVHLKPVTIGLDFGQTLEIIEGIALHDKIILNPSDRIKEGIQVEVISPHLIK